MFLVEEHPDHAFVLVELLAERGFPVKVLRARDLPGLEVAGVVLLSTATEPPAAARFLDGLADRPPRFPVFVLDGPGRRWDPASAAGNPAVAGVLLKGTDLAFLDRLGDLLGAREESRCAPEGGEAGGTAPLPDPCAGVLARVRLARLARLLERLAPLAALGGPAAAPLVDTLTRAEELAHATARAMGEPPPRVVATFRPADLVLVRRRAWEIVTGVPVRVAPGAMVATSRGDLPRCARLLDGLVLGAARAAERRKGDVRVSIRADERNGTAGRAVLEIVPRGPAGAGEACRELAEELGLRLSVEDAGFAISLPREPSGVSEEPSSPPAVLVVAPAGGPGDAALAFCRERHARVARAGSAGEMRELLAAGCRYDLAFLALSGEGLAEELRGALPRVALVGLGDAPPEDVLALLEAHGLGWLAAPARPEDLAAAWRLAAALA